MYEYEAHEDEYDFYRAQRFADPSGTSALHAGNRTHPCPTCDEPNRLTARDIQAGYQCDGCANAEEGP